MDEKKIVLEVKSLNKKYGDKVIHKDLNLSVSKGEFVAIIGNNGCGKTTLFNQIVGLVKSDSGTILANERVSLLHQNFSVQLPLSAKEYIIANLKIFGKNWDNSIEQMINEFNMREFIDVNINKLSGGERQKLNLLTSLINDPEILLLDEFTTGLDIESLVEIIDFVKEKFKKENKTIVLISHQPEEIKRIADKIMLMKDGSILDEWSIDKINEEYGDNLTSFIYEKISE